MSFKLRDITVNEQRYINVNDLFRLMLDVMTMDSLNPEAIKAIDGLAIGLALSLDMVTLADLPESIRDVIDDRGEQDDAGEKR